MYYVTYKDKHGYLHISQFKFKNLDAALYYRNGFTEEREAKILEEYKIKEYAIPPEVVAWDLLPEEPLPPNGMQKLGELLRAKLNGK